MTPFWKTGFLIAMIHQIVLVVLISVFLIRSGQPLLSGWSTRLSGWDGRIYLSLAQHGYQATGDEANFIVFFPLYPLLIALVATITQSFPLAAFVITTGASVLAHTLLYVLLCNSGYQRGTAMRIVLLFCVNPMTVYFSHAYTEALYLCLTLGGFYWLTQRHYTGAAILGLLSGMTRLVGSLFLIPFWITWWQAGSRGIRRLLSLSILIVLGFVSYALINHMTFADPLHYQQVMRVHWNKYPVNPFPKMLAEYRTLITPINPRLWTLRVDAIVTYLVFCILCVYGCSRLLNRKQPGYLPSSWFAWTAVSWYVVAAQSYWISNTRYLLLLFPLYVLVERVTWSTRLGYLFLLGVSTYLAVQGIALFATGGWLY